jgi:hypothetical protein
MSKATVADIVGYDGAQVSVDNIRRSRGIAGQVSVSARVTHTYPDADPQVSTWTLVGNVYGGPVVALYSRDPSMSLPVVEPERFGSFSADPVEYMRRYVLDER